MGGVDSEVATLALAKPRVTHCQLLRGAVTEAAVPGVGGDNRAHADRVACVGGLTDAVHVRAVGEARVVLGGAGAGRGRGHLVVAVGRVDGHAGPGAGCQPAVYLRQLRGAAVA
eukprot:124267-Prorocentrum_minimum.AAC.4